MINTNSFFFFPVADLFSDLQSFPMFTVTEFTVPVQLPQILLYNICGVDFVPYTICLPWALLRPAFPLFK